MHQKHGDFALRNGIFRRSSVHIQSELPAYIQKTRFHCRPEKCLANPWAQVKWLPDSRIRNFAERSERRLRDHRTEPRFFFQRFQNLRGTHRFAKPKDAMRMITRFNPIHPTMDIVRLL